MSILDVFNNDAFTSVSMIEAMENTEFLPQRLESLNIFTKRPIRDLKFGIEMRNNGSLGIVQTTPRGAPLPQAKHGSRNMRYFETARVGKADRLNASEIQFLRQFGTEDQVVQMQQELAMRIGGGNTGAHGLQGDLSLTMENMRLGAVQGKFMDADGTVLEDWVTAFDAPGAPATTIPTVNFDFAALADGELRQKLTKLYRDIARNSDGVWTVNTKIHVLVGDDFFDKLLKNPEIRELNKNSLTNAMWVDTMTNNSPSMQSGFDPWQSISYCGFVFENYRGTDDNTTLKIEANVGHAFPTNTNGAFQQILSPGESFDDIGTLGREWYPDIIHDEKRNRYVDIELVTYPAFVCTRPKLLRKFVAA